MDNLEKYINDFAKQNINDIEDKEYAEYSHLFQIRFGRKPYIAEPNGTKEQTIEAIKKCLEKDKDILDEILYPSNDEIY